MVFISEQQSKGVFCPFIHPILNQFQFQSQTKPKPKPNRTEPNTVNEESRVLFRDIWMGCPIQWCLY